MAKKAKGSRRARPKERTERRFEPRPTIQPRWSYAIGAVGSVALGAGAWGQFGSSLVGEDAGPDPYARAILVGGALLVGIVAWLGTSGEPALRVGSAGIAVERRGLRRMPWHAVERVTWRQEAVRVIGKDEAGKDLTIVCRLVAQPQAAAWIAREARQRIPGAVDIPSDATLPEALEGAGVTLPLEPPQVVGKHCVATGKVISYEPDARICPRCERTYHKSSVPTDCACGFKLAGSEVAVSTDSD